MPLTSSQVGHCADEVDFCLRRKAEDESKIESLEVARSSLEEKLHLAEAKRMKLEQRVSALTKQNAALAKGGTQVCAWRPDTAHNVQKTDSSLDKPS